MWFKATLAVGIIPLKTIIKTLAAMDNSFGLFRPHQYGIANKEAQPVHVEGNKYQVAAHSVHWVTCVPEAKTLTQRRSVGCTSLHILNLANFILFSVISLQNCRNLLEYK